VPEAVGALTVKSLEIIFLFASVATPTLTASVIVPSLFILPCLCVLTEYVLLSNAHVSAAVFFKKPAVPVSASIA